MPADVDKASHLRGGSSHSPAPLNELIVAALDSGVCALDRDGRIIFANAAAGDLLGRPVTALAGSSMREHLHRDGPASPIGSTLDDGLTRRADDGALIRADRSRLPVTYTVTAIRGPDGPDGAIVVFRDATEHRKLEAALKDLQRRHRALYEDTPVMLHSIDRDSRLISVSDHWLKVLGFERHEVLGRRPVDFLSEDSRRRALEVDLPAFMRDGVAENLEYEFIKKDGATVDWLLSAVAERDEAGNMDRSFAVIIDISERKRDAARMRELQAELHHVSRLSAMGTMATGLAHELNQPLTAMTNYVQASRRLLRGVSLDDKVGEYMDKAVAQAARAGAIIRRLRDFVRKGETDRSLEDLNQVVEEASALALTGMASKGVTVDFAFRPRLPRVLVDRVQIQQVVFNLVRNSVDALVDSERRHITISTSLEDPAMLRASVSDTGPGLPPEIADRLFEPFVTTKPDGMGIGLAICRSIVEAHLGRLWATPNPDGGTSFHLTLPVEAAATNDD